MKTEEGVVIRHLFGKRGVDRGGAGVANMTGRTARGGTIISGSGVVRVCRASGLIGVAVSSHVSISGEGSRVT